MRIMTLIEFVFDLNMNTGVKRMWTKNPKRGWKCIAFGASTKKDWSNKSAFSLSKKIASHRFVHVHVKLLHTFSCNLVTVISHSWLRFFYCVSRLSCSLFVFYAFVSTVIRFAIASADCGFACAGFVHEMRGVRARAQPNKKGRCLAFHT